MAFLRRTFTVLYLYLACQSLLAQTAPSITAGAATNPSTCIGQDGSIAFTSANITNGNYNLSYTFNGAPATALVTVANNGFVLSGIAVGVYTNFSLSVNAMAVLDNSTKTLTHPTAPTYGVGSQNPTTCNGVDGKIIVFNLPNSTNYVLNYKFNGTGLDFPITTNNSGQYTLPNLGIGLYENIIVSTTGLCAGVPSNKMITNPVGPIASVASTGIALINAVGSPDKYITDITNCSLISTLEQTGSKPITGNVAAKVWIDAIQPVGYAKRHYEITPALDPTTATAKVTLYFTQEDFDEYNAQMPTPATLLPINSDDGAGIANVVIEKRSGTSNNGSGSRTSYTNGALIINPDDDDISYNLDLQRWEISFYVTGFSGFFLMAAPPVCTLPVISTQPIGAKLCAGTGINLSVAASNATDYQWKLNGVNVGSNAPTLNIGLATTADLGTYTVVVSNGVSSCATNSANAIVEAKVSHFLQFQGCNCGGGGPIKVSIVGGTSPYSFEYMTSGGPSTFSNYLSGATVTLPQNITQGRAISVTDALGCKSID